MSQRNISPFAVLATGALAGYCLFKLYTYFAPAASTTPSQLAQKYESVDTNLESHEYEQLLSQFQLACEYMATKHGKQLKLCNTDKLQFYALFKTASIGANTTSKPSMLDFERSAMWNAWTELNGLSKTNAMIAYVELVHQNDPRWRDKVVSKSLEGVIGENANLACDPNQSESEDEEDKAFTASRSKSNDQRDEERRAAANERKNQDDDAKQRVLREKYANMYSTSKSDSSLAQNLRNGTEKPDLSSISSDGTHANAAECGKKKQDKSEMGPVFSSAAEANDTDVLEVTSFSIDVASASQPQSQETDHETAANVETIEADTATIRGEMSSDTPTSPGAHSIEAGKVFIRIHSGSFHDLVELNDLLIFQEVVENENILAIQGQYPQYTQEQLKNDQELLFSFSVILVDLNRLTLLHAVAEYGTPQQMGILVHTFKYPIDLKDAHGNTPLMLAIGAENAGVVEFLINNGANIHEKQTDGTSIEELVDLCENPQIQQTIQAALSK